MRNVRTMAHSHVLKVCAPISRVSPLHQAECAVLGGRFYGCSFVCLYPREERTPLQTIDRRCEPVTSRLYGRKPEFPNDIWKTGKYFRILSVRSRRQEQSTTKASAEAVNQATGCWLDRASDSFVSP